MLTRFAVHVTIARVVKSRIAAIQSVRSKFKSRCAPAVAKKFVDFLYTDAAQKTFAKNGYRPVVAADLDKSQFPDPKTLFTIDDLGGWSTVNKAFFDPDNGSISKIENELGVSGG